MCLEVGHTDPQQLPAGCEVPDADVAHPAGRKHLAELKREGEVVDPVAVGSLDELLDKPEEMVKFQVRRYFIKN